MGLAAPQGISAHLGREVFETEPRLPIEPYLVKYQAIAISEMERTGIPASIKLAQAVLESDYGRSTLAEKANNHFGIKCGGNWSGKTYHKKDDDPGSSCFRKYERAEESFYDHSEFLRDPAKKERYGFLFKFKRNDYKSWALGLENAGYATSTTYAEKLIFLIEKNNLGRYDHMGKQTGPVLDPDKPNLPPKDKPTTWNGVPAKPQLGSATGRARMITLREGVRYLVAEQGETLEALAKAVGFPASRLADYNETTTKRPLAKGERIWLTPKKNRNPGPERTHLATAGQTLYEVSQQYGIRLVKLAKRNDLPKNAVLKSGQSLKLR